MARVISSFPVVQVSAILLIPVWGISACRGPVNTHARSLVFNAGEVPFSCNLSSMSVCQNRKSQCLALTDIRFALFGRNNEIFRFFYMTDSGPAQPKALATPGMLSLSTGRQVFGKACFESKTIFRLQGKDFPMILQLDKQLIQKNLLRVISHNRNQYYLENKNRFGTSYHILSCHDGTLQYDKDKCLFRLSPSARNKYAISVEESDRAWNAKGIKKCFDECVASAQQDYDAFLSHMPSVPRRYNQARELASYILWSCLVDQGGYYQRPGMVMSKNWMHYIWSWDHCFNAMACSYHLPELAWDNYRTIFDAQDAEGRLPDVLGYARIDRRVLKPPIHGWALHQMRNEMELTASQLRDAYVCLKRWTNYWLQHRDANHNGIPEYIQSNDCWDNGTEFNINGDPNYIANRESANLSAYLIVQMDELHDLALRLGKRDDAIQWKNKSDHMLAYLIDKLWDGHRFITMNIQDGSINEKSRSLMRFLPVILGKKLPPEIRSKMIEDLTQGGYITRWGLATESIHSELYLDDGYWRGPIWAPTTLIIVDGLFRSGEQALAKDIAQKFCDLCVKSGFAENYDAKTGKGLRDPAYTWTASVFLILAHEYLN